MQIKYKIDIFNISNIILFVSIFCPCYFKEPARKSFCIEQTHLQICYLLAVNFNTLVC